MSTLTTYSDDQGTTPCTVFDPGEVVYIDGSIIIRYGTAVAAVSVKVYNANGDVVATLLDLTDETFTADTLVTLAALNGSNLLEWATTQSTVTGEYYVLVTVSGADIDTASDKERFFVTEDVPASWLWTTTADFNTGTLDNCFAESDNLYAGLYENWADSSTGSWLKKVGTWTADQEGYAQWAALSSDQRRVLYVDESMASPTSIIASTARVSLTQFNARYFWGLVSSTKLETPADLSDGRGYALAVYGGGGNPQYLKANWRKANGTAYYWTGTTWSTNSGDAKNIHALHSDTSGNYIKTELYKDTGTLYNAKIYRNDGALIETLTGIDMADMYAVAADGLYWVIAGNHSATDNRTAGKISEISLIFSDMSWRSPDITPPDDQKLRRVGVTITNGDAAKNYVSKLEIYDADTDVLLDKTGALSVYESGYINASSFEDFAKETINRKFYFKIYFTNNGDPDILTIGEISLAFETVAYVRTDGGLFRL